MSTRSWRPGLGIDEPEVAGVRKLLLARIADLDGDHVVAAGELEQRAAPVERPAEVGDDDDERALSRERARPARSLAERRRADPPSAVFVVVLGAERGEKADQPDPALSGRERLRVPVPEGDDAEPVAAAARDVADRERGALGDVGLAAVGGAEASSTATCRA